MIDKSKRDPSRKSTRKYNLEKPVERSFEIEKESEEVNLVELKKGLLADGKIDAEGVNKLREDLYADGKIDQEEADFLFELNDAVSDKPNDSSWNQFFVEAISDYLLNDEKSPGVIDDEEGKWLVEKIGADGQVDGVEKQLLSYLKTNAKKVPAAVTALITGSNAVNAASSDQMNLQQLKKELLADGKIDAEEVNKLREALYADGKIDQEEADFIFEINDAVSGKKNAPAWNQFFVQAISDFLLNDEKSPGVIDDEEGKWLVEKIGADGQVDGVEKELLINLKKRAKSMPSSVISLINSDNSRLPTPGSDASDGKSSKWKWLIPAAVVVAAVPSYFLFTGNDDTSSTEDSIVATAPEAGQTNFGDNATNPNALTGESDNPENVADSGGNGDLNNNGDSDNSAGSSNVSNGNNSPETGNASSPESGNVSSGSRNVGNTSSGAKSSTPQSSDEQSSPNKKTTSASSTASAGSSNAEARKTEVSSRRGTSEPGNSKNSSTLDNPVVPGSIEQKALDVIRGMYGNGQVRKDKLGAEYAEIQKLVNEMYRNGRVR